MSNYFVHESSYVEEGSFIGSGTKIWHFSHVMNGASIGSDCILGQNVYVGSRAIVGNHCKIQNNVSIYDSVILEDNVFCGPSSVFTNVINPRSFIERKDEYKQTLVMYGASIGANATIICGVTLGRFCFVGAGSIVSRDIPNHALVYGSPAKIRSWVCECGQKIDSKLVCQECGKKYMRRGNLVRRLPDKKEHVDAI